VNYKQARWAKHLAAYNLEIVYKLGAKNPINAPFRRLEFKKAEDIKEISLLLA
jgi:hypothetical protein